MEHFANSLNISSDFEFKYIPKEEFERIMLKAERKKKTKTGIWDSYCSITSGKNDEDDALEANEPTRRESTKVLNDNEIQSIVKSIGQQKHAKPAPFFGPARKLDIETLRNKEENSKSSSEESSSTIQSVHIVEVVNVAQPAPAIKIQVPNATTSTASSVDENNESLQAEMMKLCYEIENANDNIESGDDDSVDFTYQEQNHLRSIMDKTEEKINCETYSSLIDKEFDFLFNECKKFDDDAAAMSAQTLPVVELKRKSKQHADDDENNVWRPKVQNQIKKSGSEAGAMKKRNHSVLPSDVIIRKARDVGKLKRDVNKKSHAEVIKVDENPPEDTEPSEADVHAALGKVTQFQEKVCQYLDVLRDIIEDPPEIDDTNDLMRRQKRAIEFSNRFARNHLYQIGRTAEELRIAPDNLIELATKSSVLFQVIMQGVSSYLKNVEMFICNRFPEKLLVLIDFIINAIKVCLDRMVFDKRDSIIQKMLRKSLDIKRFLEINRQSMAKFSSIQEKRKQSLCSRTSFAHEFPQDTKLSMYGGAAVRPKKSSSKPKQFPTKSPYDAPTQRCLQTSRSHGPAKVSSSRNATQSRVNSSLLRKSDSNVSTMMQRMKRKESTQSITTVPEQLYEENASATKPKEQEIKEMLESIAMSKIQEMLGPLVAALAAKKNEKESSQEPKAPAKRVTSDIAKPQSPRQPPSTEITEAKTPSSSKSPPTKPKHNDKVQRISKNVQYLYVKSNDEVKSVPSSVQLTSSLMCLTSSDVPPTKPSVERQLKIVSSKAKPPVSSDTKKDEEFTRQFKEQAFKDRMAYAEQMAENPLYSNEVIDEPWRMFGRISDKILDELLESVVGELDFGEEAFVDSFIRHELDC